MAKIIKRYIRQYRDDAITDPTMYYVSADDMRLLSWDAYCGLVVKFDDSSLIEIVTGHTIYDERTVVLETVGTDRPDFDRFVAERGLGGVKIMPIAGIKKIPVFYEFSIVDIGEDGVVEMRNVREVKCNDT